MSAPKPPIRVVALVENNPYPFDISVRTHVMTLAEANYQITVISPRHSGQPLREIINGVQIYRFPELVSGRTTIGYLLEFSYAMLVMTLLTLWVWARHGLDVLELFCPPDSLFVAALLPKLAGKTIVCDMRDLGPELYASKTERNEGALYRLLLVLERCACQLADHVIAVNESYRRVIIERDRIPTERVSVVRRGPELNRVQLKPTDPNLRARAKTIIAYLGNMAKQDGVDHLLQALRHLDQDFGHHDWFCVLIGRADDPQTLAELTVELGIRDRTWFTGQIPDEEMLSLLSTADICVDPDPANPLNNISTMIKMMEYMALAKPVVAYDLVEHRVTAGEAALYARPNDAVDLARQLARLIEAPDLLAQLGAIGRMRIEQHLSWDHQRGHLLAIFGRLTQGCVSH